LLKTYQELLSSIDSESMAILRRFLSSANQERMKVAYLVNRTKTVACVLAAFLVVSAGFNLLQFSQNLASSKQNGNVNIKLEMSSLLTQVQLQIDTELEKLDRSLRSACNQLSATDLQSSQARSILRDLAASNSFIVNAATADAKDVLLAVEPSQYSSIEGENIANQEQNVQMHQTLRPAMSDMILLVEGFYGVVMVAPIFNANATFTGSLSIVIQSSDLIKSLVFPTLDGPPYSMWAMQTNGTLIYDF
jgi:hypothetical protein